MLNRLPTGRLERLGRLAALVPKATLALARDRLGDEGRVGEQIADTLGGLKAGSLKLGQILAQVADELPPAAQLQLGKVYSEVSGLQIDAVAEVVERSLGRPLDQLFADFEAQPFAAASIAQVHRARLLDGTEVAVKVRYPGVDAALRRDLDALGGMVGTVSMGDRVFDASRYFLELREQTLTELDLRAEASHAERLRGAVLSWPDLVVPRIYPALSSEEILTMDRMEGPTLHAVCGQLAPGARQDLAERLTRAVLGPVFSGALVNADAHPGNFVVQGERLALLDFGAVISLPPAEVAGARRLFQALLDGTVRPRADLEAAGYEFRMSAPKAQELAQAIVTALSPPFRGPHDHAADSVMKRVMVLKQERPLDLMRSRPPVGLLPVLRAMVGLSHALRRMPGPLDLRPALRAVLAASSLQ